MVATLTHDLDRHDLGVRSRTIRVHRIGWALCLSALVILAPIVGPRTAQPASRYALTAAIVDHGSIDVGPYRDTMGVDIARYEGNWRSDKGPGQPLLAVPAYALARALGGGPLTAATAVRTDLVLWWLTFTTATVPFALLLMLVYRRVARVFPSTAMGAAVAMLCGTIVLPHAVNLYGHTLSALLAFGAYCALADNSRPDASSLGVATRTRSVVAGLCIGGAVATEYHLAIVAIVLGAFVIACHRSKLFHFVLGAAVPLAGLAVYQWRAFGAPWRTPFAYFAGEINGTTDGGYSMPTAKGLLWLVTSNRGVVVSGPIVVLAVVCAMVFACRRDHAGVLRRDSIVGLAVFMGYALLVAGWSGTPQLETPGPRYLIPAIPFLVMPLAAAWPHVRTLARACGLWGIALMTAATACLGLVAVDDTIVNAYVHRVANGQFLPTIWSMAFGSIGPLLWAASALLAVRWLWHSARLSLRG